MNENPNILLIMVDQQRYDCIGYSNQYPVNTPNIDQLASEGTWFSNAFTHIPLCSPARESFLNGKRPETFGGLWNYDLGLKIPSLEPSEYAWPRELQCRNYSMGYAGKWHVNPNHGPTEYGYEKYISDEEYEIFKKKNYSKVSYEQPFLGEKDPIPVKHSHTHWLADRTSQMIHEFANREQPWHIRFDLTEPHLPCRPAGYFADMYSFKDIPMWGSFHESFENKPYIQQQQLYNWGMEDYTWEDWAPIVSRYYGIISQVDDAIGKVLKTLDQLRIAENTIVIYTTDHGDMCGGHRMIDKHYVLYDDVVKVPLVIRWPNQIKSGQKCEAFIYNLLDLPPTILDILNVKRPDFFQGRSFFPLLKGGSVSDWRNEVVSTYNGQQFGLYTQRMIRDKNWKYIWNPTDVDELYNLQADPNELVNLIQDKSLVEKIYEFRKKLYHALYKDGDGLVNNKWMKNQLLRNRKIESNQL